MTERDSERNHTIFLVQNVRKNRQSIGNNVKLQFMLKNS